MAAAVKAPRPPIHMWAIVPPPALGLEIDAIRKEFSQNYQCYKALRPPVHLTLYAPFPAPDESVRLHIDSLKSWLRAQPAFSLSLRNFSFFERSRSPVVFIDVVPNAALTELNAGLSKKTAGLSELDGGSSRFHPHFTIGYRDVPPALLPAIKKAYGSRQFNAAFHVSSVCLFRHNGIKWELLHQCALQPAGTQEEHISGDNPSVA